MENEEKSNFWSATVPMWMALALIAFVVILQYEIGNINTQLNSAEQIFTQVYQKDVLQDSMDKTLVNFTNTQINAINIMENNEAQLWYKTLAPASYVKIKKWFLDHAADIADCQAGYTTAKIGSDFLGFKGGPASKMAITVDAKGTIVINDDGTVNCYMAPYGENQLPEPDSCAEMCFGGLPE